MPRITKYVAATILALAAAAPAAMPARAAYPDRSVHFIVGNAPGGGTDIVGRVVAKQLSEMWHQAVIVENRVGSDGNIAEAFVAQSAPDGYTILVATTNHTVPPEGYKLTYDQIKSFTPIVRVGFNPNLLLVNDTVPVDTTRGLIAYARAHPGKLNFGGAGTGSPVYLAMLLFMHDAGINMVNITYPGGGAALIGLLGNEVQVLFGSVAAAKPHVEAGKLKALAISTAIRSPIMPQVPSVAESTNFKDYDQAAYIALVGPARLPPEVVKKVHDDLVTVAADPAVKQTLSDKLGFIISTDTPEELQTYFEHDLATWTSLLQNVQRK